MKNEQQKDDPADSKTQATVDSFLEHLQGAMQSVTNLRWDDVKFHLESMEALAEAAPPSARPFIDAISEPTRGFALGFQLFSTGKTAGEKEKALEYLNGAKTALRKARAEQRELINNPGFAQFAMGIDSQILSIQEQIARDRGDTNGAALLAQQRAHLVDDMIASLDPDDPMRHFLEAMKLLQEAVPNFTKGLQCLFEMNLDLAQHYFVESSKSLSAMHDHFSKAKTDALIAEAGQNAAEGVELLVSGQGAYVRTLRTAILGDVNRNDVDALEKAEKAFVDGAELIQKAAQAMPGVFGELNLGPAAAAQAQLTHNLRTLCERSLSPKVITITTAPKVVFYFVGTFVVLLIGLPISGLVAHLQSSDLGLLLIVSLFVSVIGAFGFEATRLVPLFEVFSRLLPWGRGSQDTKAKAP